MPGALLTYPNLGSLPGVPLAGLRPPSGHLWPAFQPSRRPQQGSPASDFRSASPVGTSHGSLVPTVLGPASGSTARGDHLPPVGAIGACHGRAQRGIRVSGLAQGQQPPTHSLSTGCKLNRLNSVVGEYAGACVQVAQDCGVDVLDLWTLMQKDTQVRGWLGPQGEHKPTDGTPL